MSTKLNEQKKQLSVEQIQKEILFWNINTLNNVIAYGDMIERVENKQKPNKHDLEIRDFYFTKKLTIDGKFQPETFLDKSIDYLKNFSSLDKNSYLQSVNFENNIKKYRFWQNIISEVPKDKETHQSRQKIEKIVWLYRLPTFAIFASMTYVFMAIVGFTKMKTGKQLATLGAGMYIANIFIERRKATQIFYDIPELESKTLEKKRKELINQSVILDGKIYVLDKQLDFESNQLMQQVKHEEDPAMKKALLEAAGFEVIDSADKVF